MKKSTLTQDKAKNSPSGGVVVGKRNGQTMIYDDASVGGYFVGKTHKEGGIQMINKSNGQPLEVQGSEVIITAPAVADNTKREFEGKMMTNREILSDINEKGGGVSFAKGGDVPKSIKHIGASYKYGGKTMTDHEIMTSINKGGTMLLAPNGKPSNLNTQQYKLVRTPAFKKWFGNWENDPKNASKVVDENGEPMVVYHTTSAEFNVFSKKKSKEGFFFAPQKERLSVYNKSNVNSYFLNLRNPSHEMFKSDLKYLIPKGYDGIMDYGHAKHLGNKNLYEIIAFEPNQIKLADGTNTTFDSSNPDIRFKSGGHLAEGFSLRDIADIHQVPLADLKKQVRLGMKAESEHTSSKREQMQIVKDHLFENPEYYTLLDKAGLKDGGYFTKDEKYEIGGIFHGSPYSFDKFTTERMGSGSGKQIDGWGIYLTDSKDSSKIYGRNIYETTLFKDKDLNEYTFIDLAKPVKKDIVSKIVKAVYEKYNKDFDINKFNLYYDYAKDKSLPKVDFNDYELIEFDYAGFLFYKTLSRILGGDKKASLFLLDNGIDGLKRNISKTRTDYIIFDADDITIDKKESFANGGQTENLVKDAKSGNTPARDLNNYNDVLDLQADNMVGAETGLFEDGGELNVNGFTNEELDQDLKEVYQNRAFKNIGGTDFYFSRLNVYPLQNVFTIELSDGTEIGRATLNEKENYLTNIRLDENYRRKGLASNLYDYIEYIIGNKLKPSPDKISKEAQNLWIKRNPNITFATGGDVKPYDANMEGDSVDMMFADGGAVSSVVKNWNEVPSIWKDISKVKKVAFTNSPYDKGLYSIVAPFLGKDDLRPIMSGINFDDNGITVTNAHVLITLPYPSKQFEGVYEADLSKKANPEQITIEGNYPNYSAIIPKMEVTKPFFIDIYKLLQYNNVAMKFVNKYTYAVNYKINDEKVGFNAKFLNESLKTLLKLGHETAYAHYIAPNKALLLSPSKDYEIGNDELVLTMPVMVKDYEPLGVRDIDYGRELSVYFDFDDNQIHNADGSIADFKMKYEQNSIIDKDDVNLLQKLANGKQRLEILNSVLVENGLARASDLETEYYLSGVDLPNGIYKPIQGALEITMEAIEDFPTPPIFVTDEDTLQFVISSDILEYYIDKLKYVVGQDDLRPVMQGICLHHTSDNKLFLAGTDAHILLKVNITEYVDMPVYNKEMKFIIQPKRLYDFLNSTENTALTIKSNLVATSIQSDNWSFYARNIDGNYPNYDAVMPKETTKLAVVNLEPIKKAFNTEMVKNYVREASSKDKVFIFNKENEIFIATYSSGDNIEKICETNVDFSLKDYYNENQSVLLFMPFGYGKQTNFAFRKDLVDRVLKIVNDNKLELHYTELNRPYLIPIHSFEYKTTTKEHKVKEQKPSIAEIKLVSTINEVNEIKEAIETLEMLSETATRKDKKEIKEAVEVLQMLLDTYEY